MRGTAALLTTTAVLCAACGGSAARRHERPPARTARATSLALRGPALGLTEDNANLLRSPQAAPDGPFSQARALLSALHPAYIRLVIDWAALQPQPDRPPALDSDVDGCARGVAPCGAFAGVRAQLAAIATRQRAAGDEAFQVVIDILGTPSWAAAKPFGCELSGVAALARAPAPSALEDYRGLIDSLLRLGEEEGVQLRWWSPWNEPNDPRFIDPQRERCAAEATPTSALTYAALARTMAEALKAAGGQREMILGELQGLTEDSPHTTSIGRFVASLPEDVVCLAAVWSVHAYASYGPGADGPEPVQALESALDARGGCASHAQVWVTEAGTGAPRAGQQRPAGTGAEREGCEALARQLARWYYDPRLGAVFQYSFRQDPDFQVGLVSADLGHLYPAYGLWLAYVRSRAASEPPPAPTTACKS
jgi:hypothetical protein